ncbi:MAG: ABC transporter substrate-binding protein, partial [Gemmatimonadetes bacterium]|nr:ABC transporter substrate-binding protein [Gemmatimonadota bacterium]
MNRSRVFFLSTVVVALFGGCRASSPGPERAVVLGAVLPLTGPASHAGEAVRTGLELAVASREGNPRWTIRAVDGGGDPMLSVRRARELAADPEVRAVVGGWSAATARPLAAALESAGVAFVALSPLAVPPGVESRIVSVHRAPALAAAAAQYARDRLDAGAAAIVRDPASATSMALAEEFAFEFTQRGGEIPWTLDLDEDGEPLRPAGREPELDVLFAATPYAAAAAAAARGDRLRGVPMLLLEGWDDEGASAAAADHVLFRFSFWTAEDPSPEARKLRGLLRDADASPTTACAFGWDAVTLVAEAARVAGV